MDATIDRVEAADGSSLAIHVIGSGPPVVVFPGGPARASAYLEDLAGLSATHTLLRIDTRGSGLSPLPDDRESLSFPRLADDIEAVRVARGLDQIDLLAHSAGCFVALVYAARYPDRVARLVLVTPSGRGFADTTEDVKRIRATRTGESWYAEAHEIEEMLEYAPAHRRNRFDPGLRAFGYAKWDERARAHSDSTDGQMSMRAGAAFWTPETQIDMEWLRSSLASMTAPVLVIVGSHDGMTGVQAGRVIADLMPRSSVVELPDSAHYPWVDAPDQFREALVSFFT
jgi:pimeloyl-ACP methyl ester carboxylesterase